MELVEVGAGLATTERTDTHQLDREQTSKVMRFEMIELISYQTTLHLSAREQRLSVVLILIAVIFILSSLPRIIIMMYDLIIIERLR